MDSLWLNVKTSGSNSALIYGAVGVVVIAAILVIVFVSRKKKMEKRRALYKK
jgi:LPXTG-motif cell wall-anchored protein